MLLHMIQFLVTIAILYDETNAAVYMTDRNHNKVIEMTHRAKPCQVHTDLNVVDKLIRSAIPNSVQYMSSNDLDALGSSCRDMDQLNKFGGFFYPGTKWCGPGNIADSFNDLGCHTEEDKCCREHDHCPNQLEPGQCRQGICNMSPFTRSHCDCDDAFKRCLREVNSDTANAIGNIFFNVLQITCFKDRRTCPQSMREDSSYTWFCEEWKFAPSGEFTSSLVTRQVSSKDTPEVPEKSENVKPGINSVSSIDENLQDLFEKDPNVRKVMSNGKSVMTFSNLKSSFPQNVPSVLNSIPDGEKVWRD